MKAVLTRKIAGLPIYDEKFKVVKNVNHLYPVELAIIGCTKKAIRIKSQVNFKELWLPLRGLVYLEERKAFTFKKWMRNNELAYQDIMDLFG